MIALRSNDLQNIAYRSIRHPTFRRCPIFWQLLEKKGFTEVLPDDVVDFSPRYLRNTAVISTVSTDDQGHWVKITDFVLCFHVYAASFICLNWLG